MTTKVLMSDYADRVLIDWRIVVDDGTLTGTWAFDRRNWKILAKHERFGLLMDRACEEIAEHDGWERFPRDEDELDANDYTFTPRQPLGKLGWSQD